MNDTSGQRRTRFLAASDWLPDRSKNLNCPNKRNSGCDLSKESGHGPKRDVHGIPDQGKMQIGP